MVSHACAHIIHSRVYGYIDGWLTFVICVVNGGRWTHTIYSFLVFACLLDANAPARFFYCLFNILGFSFLANRRDAFFPLSFFDDSTNALHWLSKRVFVCRYSIRNISITTNNLISSSFSTWLWLERNKVLNWLCNDVPKRCALATAIQPQSFQAINFESINIKKIHCFFSLLKDNTVVYDSLTFRALVQSIIFIHLDFAPFLVLIKHEKRK